MTRHSYGPDPSQFGDLYLPAGTAKKGLAVVLHGGFWLAEYDLSLGAPLAADLASRGFASFNLEYRRVGDGGGWPTTLQDVADGIDLLASLNVDTSHVVAIGHSAGGQPRHGPPVACDSLLRRPATIRRWPSPPSFHKPVSSI